MPPAGSPAVEDRGRVSRSRAAPRGGARRAPPNAAPVEQADAGGRGDDGHGALEAPGAAAAGRAEGSGRRARHPGGERREPVVGCGHAGRCVVGRGRESPAAVTRRRGPGSRPGEQTSGTSGEARGDARSTQVSTKAARGRGNPTTQPASASDSEARPCPTRERRGGSPHATAVARARWTASAARRASCLTAPLTRGWLGTAARTNGPSSSTPGRRAFGHGRRGARKAPAA